MVYITYY